MQLEDFFFGALTIGLFCVSLLIGLAVARGGRLIWRKFAVRKVTQ